MITAPVLIVDKIKDAILQAVSYVKTLRRENRGESHVTDEELDNHYVQLEHYLARARDKTSGAARYIERKVEKLNEEK
jgi:hypothetical protein